MLYHIPNDVKLSPDGVVGDVDAWFAYYETHAIDEEYYTVLHAKVAVDNLLIGAAEELACRSSQTAS